MKWIKKTKRYRIQFNEQGKCPVCGNDDIISNASQTRFEYLDEEYAGECGYFKTWQCGICKCTGKEYYEFADHYDVCQKNGVRVDSENEGDFPYLKRNRLFSLLKNTLNAIHNTTSKDPSYESLGDLQKEIGITADEYDAVMGGAR